MSASPSTAAAITPEASPRLHAPPAYIAADPAAIVRSWPFALLLSPGLHATSTPLFFEHDDSEATLVGHIARRNPQASVLAAAQDVLAIFSGPHAYISPRWYLEKPEVPTWNYVAAHVRGKVEPISDDAGQLAVLERIAAVMEAGAERPWTMDQAPAGRVAFLLPLIFAFRIRVERIEGVTKLNQTHPPGDRMRVATALRATPEGAALAQLMLDSDL